MTTRRGEASGRGPRGGVITFFLQQPSTNFLCCSFFSLLLRLTRRWRTKWWKEVERNGGVIGGERKERREWAETLFLIGVMRKREGKIEVKVDSFVMLGRAPFFFVFPFTWSFFISQIS